MSDNATEKKKPKTMRSANIRISAINNTKNGLVTYTFEDVKETVYNWCLEKDIEYFMIEHNENKENIHYHLVLKFGANTRFETVKNKFPYGNIENSKSVRNSIQYLIHMNSPEKYQYDPTDIITNSKELNKYLLRSKVSDELDLNYYIDEITSGRIREYEYTEKIPSDIYTKYSNRIEKAFKYYYDKCLNDSNRNIEVEFYYGAGGTGKTLYAKTLCEIYGESYCVSSSSNDVLQDYKGQDVLILDDLRDDVFKFDDLLKILDNNTKSSIKSRYRNKVFIGKRIIITSNIELYDWYRFCKEEDIHQLHRRIPVMLKFTREKISTYLYSNRNKKYIKKLEQDNDVLIDESEEDEEIEFNNRLKRYKFI